MPSNPQKKGQKKPGRKRPPETIKERGKTGKTRCGPKVNMAGLGGGINRWAKSGVQRTGK